MPFTSVDWNQVSPICQHLYTNFVAQQIALRLHAGDKSREDTIFWFRLPANPEPGELTRQEAGGLFAARTAMPSTLRLTFLSSR